MRLAPSRLRRATALLAVSALAAAGLAGCQLFEVQVPERTPSAIENCVSAQAWVLDPATAAANVTERLAQLGTSGEVLVDGGQTLRWSTDGDIVLESDLRITVTNPGPPALRIEQTVRGEATGQAVFSGDVAVPRNWSTTRLTVTETMTQDEVPVDPAPWSIGRTWIDDTVGLIIECLPDRLEIEARGTKLRWTFHPEGWTPAVPSDETTETPATQG